MTAQIITAMLDKLVHEPKLDTLLSICTQLEILDNFAPKKDEVKSLSMKVIMSVNDRIPQLQGEENLLRLYQIVGKHSRTMGGSGVMDKLDSQGHFNTSLKFHVMWAESKAKLGDAADFEKIVGLARHRLAHLDKDIVESSLKEVAQEFLPNCLNLFSTDVSEETAVIFGRRRSSVAFLQKAAASSAEPTKSDEPRPSANDIFGKNTNTKIRRLLIDRSADGYVGISAEEFREAMLKDQQDMNFENPQPEDMEISFTKVENMMPAQPQNQPPAPLPTDPIPQQKRRGLQALSEKEEEDPQEMGADGSKKMRFFSPAKPVVAARFPQTQTKIIPPEPEPELDMDRMPAASEKPNAVASSTSISEHYAKADYVFSETINDRKMNLLSEETDIAPPTTFVAAAAPFEVYVDEDSIDDNADEAKGKETEKTSGRGNEENEREQRQKEEEMELLAEKAYNKKSDKEKFIVPPLPLTTETKRLPLREKIGSRIETSTPKKTTEEDDSDMAKMPPHRLGVAKKAEAEATVQTQSKQPPTQKQAAMQILASREKPDFLEDDDTVMAGFAMMGNPYRTSSGIITSTPALGKIANPTHDDFLAVPADDDEEESMQEEELLSRYKPKEEPVDTFKASGFMQRRSLAASKFNQGAAPRTSTAPPIRALEADVKKKLTLTEKEDDRMVDEDEGDRKEEDAKMQEEPEDDEENPHDTTGVGLPSVITSTINPWARELRDTLLTQVSKPSNQINHKEMCPKVMQHRQITLGSKKYVVQQLLGEGGFARVFKAQEQQPGGNILAVKYEVPSCAWEMYILSEVRARISAQYSNILSSIMKVTEAHIFTNASLLFNEYLPLGNLLDLTNKLNDPSWSTSLLIAIHTAKILQAVHSAQIIHADIKPDNIMIIRKLGTDESVEDLLCRPLLRLIDWGRAIDMMFFEQGTTFTGKAGTTSFDCPEMQYDRPWTYQTDYFGFAMTIGTFVCGKYPELIGEHLGSFSLSANIKRRNVARQVILNQFQKCCNIESCQKLPDWEHIIEEMVSFFKANFDPIEFRVAAGRFNHSLPSV
ncbi:hypothetical protein WR25_19135 [Diploscapter pachys]|uniref:Protein kinase domain-containing protein n=1 Tax=Diploscapter pachys TaxID=2018661 RepID=A0A2A2LJQ0_9BILA|nr:hypothetical protein WR25_19135 [Diploscapter pachys]